MVSEIVLEEEEEARHLNLLSQLKQPKFSGMILSLASEENNLKMTPLGETTKLERRGCEYSQMHQIMKSQINCD